MKFRDIGRVHEPPLTIREVLTWSFLIGSNPLSGLDGLAFGRVADLGIWMYSPEFPTQVEVWRRQLQRGR